MSCDRYCKEMNKRVGLNILQISLVPEMLTSQGLITHVCRALRGHNAKLKCLLKAFHSGNVAAHVSIKQT